MSAPYSAEDARNILEAFIAEYLVDVPASGINEREMQFNFGGEGESTSFTQRDLLFSDASLETFVFFSATDEWFANVAALATEAHEEG